MKIKILLLSFALSLSLFSLAQKSNPQWMYLAQYENITTLAEDSFNIWVGTTTGLIKIDKATEQKVVYNMVNSDIPINYITKLFVDHNQNLWLANREQKLVKYNGQTWTEYDYLDTNTNNYHYKNIEAIAEDNNGNMWFSTYKMGVVKYDGQQFIHYTKYHDIIDDKDMPLRDNYAIETDSVNDIWMGVFAGIATYHHQGYWSDLGNWNAWNGIPAGEITVLKNDKNGLLWAASRSSGVVYPSIPGGEISYHDATGWHFVPDPNHYISAVNDISSDNSGNLYAATSGSGVLQYDGSQLTRLTYSNAIIKSHFTSSVLYDSQGTLWIGTDKGLYKRNGNSITRVKMPSTNLENNYLSGRYEKKDGTVYLQYTYNVKYQMLSVRSKIFKVSGNDTIEFLNPTQDFIDFQYEDSLGNIWGNVDWQYPLIKLYDTTIQAITIASGMNPNPGQIYNISWDKTKKLFWLGTQNGLFTYSPNNNMWAKKGNFMNSTYPGQILSVFVDSTGYVWAGSVLSGPAKYQNNQWISLNYSWTMFNKTINEIVEDKQHNLWFFAVNDPSIGRYTGSAWNVYNDMNAPLSYESISGFDFDKNNSLYVCQQNSDIRVFNGAHWDSALVINSNLDSYIKNVFVDNNNNIWFTGNGVTIYNPDGIVLSNQSPQHQHKLQKQIAEVFPNPSTGKLNIKPQGNSGVKEMVLYNIQGKIILQRDFIKPNKGIITLNIGEITPGIYVLYIKTDSGIQNSKVIISR